MATNPYLQAVNPSLDFGAFMQPYTANQISKAGDPAGYDANYVQAQKLWNQYGDRTGLDPATAGQTQAQNFNNLRSQMNTAFGVNAPMPYQPGSDQSTAQNNAFAGQHFDPATGGYVYNDPNTPLYYGMGNNTTQPQQAQQSPSATVSQPSLNPYLNTQPAPVSQPGPAQPASTGAVQPQQSPQSGMPQNPYLPQIGNALTAQSNQNLFQNVLPQIGRNSVATGGYGGSRQGVAEGVAMGNAQTGLDAALASMYGGAWNNDQNLAQQRYSTDVGANTAKYGYDTNAATSRYGTDVGAQTTRYGYDTNAATSRYGTDSSSQLQNRNLDLSANQQGFNQYLASLNAQLGLGTGQSQVGQEQMDASKAPLNTYSNLVNPYTGLGGTKTTTDPATGGGAAGALGGAMTAAQLFDLIFNPKKKPGD